jgi:glycosyltransferase involved in cell wall biosynthesis
VNVGFSLLTLFPGRVGGSESNVRGLLEEFAAGTGPSTVTVLANRHVMSAYGSFERGPVRLHEVSSYRPGDGTLTRTIAMAGAAAWPGRAAREVPGDLDLIHYPVTVPIPATDRPRVVTLHDLQHHDLPHLFSRAERTYRHWAYDGSARRASVVVTSSQFSRGRIVDLLGIEPDRIEVVHFGIDTNRFEPAPQADDDEPLENLSLPPRFAFYPANLWPHKNHDRLLEALALLRDTELELVLTGQDYGRLERLRGRARKLGVESRIHHLGHVPARALSVLYRRAALLVFPSLYEGFGAPPLEAMASGCPVAASERASIPEVCQGAALLFDPESPDSIAATVRAVLDDEELRARLRADGLERAKAFTWRVAAERHQAIYEQAAET